MLVEKAIKLINDCIFVYHELNELDGKSPNSFPRDSFEYLVYEKAWTDNIQWHLEDIIRDPSIDPAKALELKRKIDRFNQRRTDLVESLDDLFFEKFSQVEPAQGAPLNTETPAWAFDRLSILELKLWHMGIEAERTDVSDEQQDRAINKFKLLKEQESDLSTSIQQLLDDLAAGRKIMKVYRQFKMYNDETLNPVLYKSKKKH